MKKPIFRVFITYEIKSKKAVRRGKKGTLDTFVLTSNLEEIEKDKDTINRICYVNRKKPEDVEVKFLNIEIENQYGETNDRFPDEY
jgi:hypothetical protein|tara:strand:- start:186 stop:443 length:258 start_codon:yes stop_codon:yes gene_type:complete